VPRRRGTTPQPPAAGPEARPAGEPEPVPPIENPCCFCGATAPERPHEPTPLTDASGQLQKVCLGCREKARRHELVNQHRPSRAIRVDGPPPPNPKLELAHRLEQLCSQDGIRCALEAESDPWRFLNILHDRLVDAPKASRTRDAQEFLPLFRERLISLSTEDSLHALVTQGRSIYGYDVRPFEREVHQARPVERQALDDVEPWSEEVDGAAVLNEIVAKNREFLIIKDEEFDGIALWNVMTHCCHLFDFAAYLLAKSAEKRCAKTRVQDINAPISNTPIVATGLKPETLFRLLEKYHPTLHMDECHLYIKKSEDHQLVLNGGFQKGKPVYRCVGDSHDPQPFDIFGPKCLASIGDLPDTIEDRSLIVEMVRKTRGQRVRPWERGEQVEREELRPIRRRIKRWCLDHIEALRAANPEIPQALKDANDRAVDIWRPLFAIADVVGGGWPERARHAAVFLTERAVESAPETAGTELLRNLRAIYYPHRDGVPTQPREVVSIARLVARLNEQEDWMWKTYSNGHPLSGYSLKKLLGAYKVKSRQRHITAADEYGHHNGERVRGFWRDELDPVFERYLPELAPDRDDVSPAATA
jgi:hypothetical protein